MATSQPPAYYPPQAPTRPIGVAILAILVILGGVLLLLFGIGVLVLSAFAAFSFLPVFGLAGAILGGVLLILALVWIGVGVGLWHLRSWAWWLAVIVMVITIVGSLPSVVIAILPILILVYLIVVRHHFR